MTSDEQPTPRRRIVAVPRVRVGQCYRHRDDERGTWRVVRVVAGIVSMTRSDGVEGETDVWSFADPSWTLVGDVEVQP